MKRSLLIPLISFILVVVITAGVVFILWLRRQNVEPLLQENIHQDDSNEVVNNNEVLNNAVINVTNTSGSINIVNNSSVNLEPVPVPLPMPTVWTEISRGDSSKKQVIFTFDGGSGNQSAQKILDTLAKHKVHATFFLTGKFAETNPSYTKKFAEAGHEVFNHTFNHPDLTKASDATIQDELNAAETTISSMTGKTTKPYFRPPYGARNQHVRDVAKSLGYRSVFWTVDALDWKESQGVTAAQVKSKILTNVSPGTIYLMHIGDNLTGQVLDDVFTEIENKGYKIVPLSQGL